MTHMYRKEHAKYGPVSALAILNENCQQFHYCCNIISMETCTGDSKTMSNSQ